VVEWVCVGVGGGGGGGQGIFAYHGTAGTVRRNDDPVPDNPLVDRQLLAVSPQRHCPVQGQTLLHHWVKRLTGRVVHEVTEV